MTARRDYSLAGTETKRAFERGLVSGEWYKPEISRERMKELMRRSDFPALWHLFLWLGLVAGLGTAMYFLWPSWWMAPVFFVYSTLLVGSSDPRWHECGHGTAFKTNWLNNVVYQFACFNLLREPAVWRWSHTRHHTDSIVVGRDPEIITPRPPDFPTLVLVLVALNLHQFKLKGGVHTFRHVFTHALGIKTFPESDFVPESEWPKVFWTARVWLVLWAAVVAIAIVTESILPFFYVGLPWFFGHWLALAFGVTQHLGLADDVLDHRLNTRTIYMNPVLRFLYLNMNYHVEHHIFPMVPYHALPKLHEEIKSQLPEPAPSAWAAYKEFVPVLIRQLRDPEFWIRKDLPAAPEREAATAD